jgi:hypothetical protein
VITQENARFSPRIGYIDYRVSVPVDFLTTILMAQVCGGTTFDFVARRKHEVAQKVMSRAADIWAAGGRGALDVDSVIAVILRIFLARWSEYGGLRQEVRTLERWLPLVGTAEKEADALVSQVAPAKNVADVLSQLSAEISSAAEQWSLGNPEEPPHRTRIERCCIHSIFAQTRSPSTKPKAAHDGLPRREDSKGLKVFCSRES